MLDSSITAVHAEWHGGFIFIIVTSLPLWPPAVILLTNLYRSCLWGRAEQFFPAERTDKLDAKQQCLIFRVVSGMLRICLLERRTDKCVVYTINTITMQQIRQLSIVFVFNWIDVFHKMTVWLKFVYIFYTDIRGIILVNVWNTHLLKSVWVVNWGYQTKNISKQKLKKKL